MDRSRTKRKTTQPKAGALYRPDGQRLFMANGKMVTMQDINKEIKKKPPELKAEDNPEKIGSILLSAQMRLPTRWSPTRSRRQQLRATSPIKTGHSYCVQDSENTADAWPLVLHDSVDDSLKISKRYDKFVSTGLKSKTGVNDQPAADEVVESRFKEYYMPSSSRVALTKRLQESVYFENERINKLVPKPLRQFGKQDRPHHVPKTRLIPYAFPN